MTNHGDDCYFFYYSSCSKGDSCPFRHCEAAMGNETVCNLWEEGRCFRTVCKFRHMEITKNRKEIPCYWESQSAGCQKPHCAFFHDKPRHIDGVFVPANKSLIKMEEQQQQQQQEEPAAPLPTAANPQLRGVIKTEAQDPVPSPTHPPVVINPADDDEDEDDQFSEEGEDSKVGPSPRKSKSESLNFGVSTLEEIRLRKALKASMKRAGYPIQSADATANGEKENIQAFFRPAFYEARDGPETMRPRPTLTERLGRKIPTADLRSGDNVPLMRNLASRLGRMVDEEAPSMPPHKALKPMRERLGLSAGSEAPAEPAVEMNVESRKPSEEIRIKTLEEIRQEKAAKSQNQKDTGPEGHSTKASKGLKRSVTVKDNPVTNVKAFSEIISAKKKRLEENSSPKNAKPTAEKSPGRTQGGSDTPESAPEALNPEVVRVKTLEEIRREKAARIQTQQVVEADDNRSSDSEERAAKKPRLLRTNKPQNNGETDNNPADGTTKVMEKPQSVSPAAPQIAAPSGGRVKVKTFEEIMKEKRLRRQEMEQQVKGSNDTEPTAEGNQRLTAPKVCLTSPSSSPAASETSPPTQKLPARKLMPLACRAASPLHSAAPPDNTCAAVASVTVTPTPSPPEASPSQNPRNSITVSPAKQPRVAALDPVALKPVNSNKKKSPEHKADAKVRPKLNVKPSVMKTSVVKPGQKRKGGARSAVAAVKPLNSAPTVQEEPMQELVCTGEQEFASSSGGDQMSSNSGRLMEELHNAPVYKSLNQEAKLNVSVSEASEACSVPQSPVMKSPTQAKARRASVAKPRPPSAVDDFEELIKEFTDDHEEEDVDQCIGEDDLLQELSEMIDS